MVARNLDEQRSMGVAAMIVFTATLLLLPILAQSDNPLAKVSLNECKIDGFGPGGSAEEMRDTFGEPEPNSIAKKATVEHPHWDYKYAGLKIVFSTHGRSAMSYFVSTESYRLTSDIGVGSTSLEVERVLGEASRRSSGNTRYISYRIVDADGRPLPARLTFTLDGEIVSDFSVVTW